MKVYVVWDESTEVIKAVFSTREAAMKACDDLDPKKPDGSFTPGTWHVWDEFELDKQPEVAS